MPTFTPAPPVINGTSGAYKQPSTFGRDGSGFFSVFNYEGTSAAVLAEAASWEASGAQYEVTDLHGGRKRLTARISGGSGSGSSSTEEPENVWELQAQESTKDLLEADFGNFEGTIGAGEAAISKKTREFLGKIAAHEISGHWDENTFQTDGADTYIFDGSASNGPIYGLPTADVDKARSYYFLIKAGVTSFPIEASVVRHTQIVSNTYAVQASFTNVGRILSTNSFQSTEGVPSSLLFGLPATPSSTQFIETANDLAYGWRKSRPSVSRLSFIKWQITNSWQFGLWATKIYGNVI